jgi:acetyl-CoA C-acetyltransferase
MVLTPIERARDLKRPPVLVQGFAESFRHHMTPFAVTDWLDEQPLRSLADGALAMARLDRAELDMVQIYDAFTINVPLGLEAMGFCEAGGAAEFMRGGRIGPGGDFPVNTSGGGLSFNHSGQFGMQLTIETVRQLRGECGARQVADARHALVQACGMVMSAYIVMVLAAA